MGSHERIIGLCGKIASGKDAVAHFLKEEGFIIIDADKIGHEALKEKQDIIVKTFGDSIVNTKGEIERKKLGEIVFSEKNKLLELEAITHPWIKEKVINLVKEHTEKKVLINAALLYPIGLDFICNKILVVQANFLIRMKRLILKRKWPFLYSLKIILNQKKIVYKNSKNIIIKNESSLENLKKTLLNLNL